MAELEQRPRAFDSLRDWWEAESRRPTGGSPAARIHQLYRRRNVLRMLITRDLKKRYENSYLGYVWTVLEPALLLAIYFFVFHKIAKFGVHDFLAFMAPAMMPWLWFRSTIRGASGTIAGNSKLVSSINLPREIYPLALALTEGVEYLLTLPLVLAIALAYGDWPTWRVALLPIGMLLELIFCIGVALLMAALTTLFKDLDRILSTALRVMFYLTPVIYPTGRIHNNIAHQFFVLDPLVFVMELHRKVFFPETHISGSMIATCVVGSLLTFVVGWAIFIRCESAMLKEI